MENSEAIGAGQDVQYQHISDSNAKQKARERTQSAHFECNCCCCEKATRIVHPISTRKRQAHSNSSGILSNLHLALTFRWPTSLRRNVVAFYKINKISLWSHESGELLVQHEHECQWIKRPNLQPATFVIGARQKLLGRQLSIVQLEECLRALPLAGNWCKFEAILTRRQRQQCDLIFNLQQAIYLLSSRLATRLNKRAIWRCQRVVTCTLGVKNKLTT